MAQSIGVGIIARNAGNTIKSCIKSFAPYVDQIVVVLAGESTDNTAKEARKASPKVELFKFDWIDDFSAARNYSFSKLKTDFLLWVDADDEIYQAKNLREIVANLSPDIGCVWFPYHYALDEFKNLTTLYERERLLRASCGWVWRGRIHETVSPLQPCKYVKTDTVILRHDHLAGSPRHERNFRILNIMLREDPQDKRIWLYLGHQHFASQNWMDAAQWYLKFGTDIGALPLERYQALCYCSKALREMRDKQAIDVALMAVALYPNYRDAYLETAHSYLHFGDIDKALHYAQLSDVKDIITEPPHVIFVNPMEYTFNKYALFSECYLKKGDFNKALFYLFEAQKIRPTEDIKRNIDFIHNQIVRNRVDTSIKTLATHLLDNKELVKLRYLKEITPYWWRDLPDYLELQAGIKHHTSQIKDESLMTEGDNNSVMVNIANTVHPELTLVELDKKYDKITVVAPFPTSSSKQINVYSQRDMEDLIMSTPGRHLLNLRREQSRILCEYDRNIPQFLSIRMFLGQGLEYWSPQTISEIGCGGSETAMARIAQELAKQDCQPILYAMDNQIWDGVIYRHHSDFSPAGATPHLFISSRIPEVFNSEIPALQKWLWMHDIHCGDRLTADIAERIDVIVCLSHWHLEHIKRTYPFLKDAKVIDMDDADKTYEDLWTPYTAEDAKLFKLPKLAIIGNGLDTARFKELTEIKNPHRFIWCSSPDRGLEQVLNLWSAIKTQLPDAELKIFYGWEYFDSTLFIPAQRELKARLRKLIQQDGVEWCGRVGQEQLAKELMKAGVMLYPPPHDFRETYGIAFLEAQAAGVICFYRQNGALGETIGKRGVPLAQDMKPEDIVRTIVDTLADTEHCGIIRDKGREYALSRDWSIQSEKVIKLYKEGEDEQN